MRWRLGVQIQTVRLRGQRKSQEIGFERGSFKCRACCQQVLRESVTLCCGRREFAPSAFPHIAGGDRQDAVGFHGFSLEPFAQIAGGTENAHKSRVDRGIRERLLG